MALARLGRRAEARRQFEIAIEQLPDYAEAYNELAIVLREEGQLDEAAAQLAHALQLDPESPDFHYQLGRLHLENHDDARAIEEFRIALARNPDHFQANYDLADTLVARGDPAAARPYLERAARLRAGDPEAVQRLDELRKRIAGEIPAAPADAR
jgi:tetratricopeptide (TPR) repeat protein